MAVTDGIIQDEPEIVRDAAKKVASEMNMHATEGPINVTVRGFTSSQFVAGADLVVGRSVNNADVFGAMKFLPEGKATHYYGAFSTQSGDPTAESYLFYELTKQQILMDKGLLKPVANEFKSKSSYVLWTMLNPVLGVRYLEKNNPLLSSKLRPYLYLQNGFGELVLAGCLISAVFNTNPDTRKENIIGGLVVSALWRFFTLLNLSDVTNYNNLARTGYDVKQVPIR